MLFIKTFINKTLAKNDRMGVKEDNAVLEEKLGYLKDNRVSIDLMTQSADLINNILYNAIVECPNEVNAVQIETKININKPYDMLPDSRTCFSGRYKFSSFFGWFIL